MNETTPSADANDYVELAAEVVSAYVANNAVGASDLPALIKEVYSALKRVASDVQEEVAQPLTPAVPIRKSVAPDYIVCLEDGKKFKSLKRHLRTRYNMTPQEYREKWGLPADYPMVAPSYAAARSELAKKMGLGQQRRKQATPEPAKRGRRKVAGA